MGELTTDRTVHVCIDMQRMFAEPTPWQAPRLAGVLPAVEALVDIRPARTVFTRFLPPYSEDEAVGAWKSYYQKWGVMTRAQIAPELLDLVPSLARYIPPAAVVDKNVYSPWFQPHLIRNLRAANADTIVVTGGETDVCVAATVMGAIDHGLRVVLPTDAVFGSADETHDAMLRVFQSRFALQLETCTIQELLEDWRPQPMTLIGYHASHEQFAPSELRDLVVLAEKAGFLAAKSSDHFHPWSERQAQSGFAWSWLGAAMQATSLPFGIISAPGYRYHPAVLAQAATTCGEMFPDRLWLALGSGEAINEAITGTAWPEKAERNARLAECVEVIRALFAGETVTHRGRVTVVEARLYSRPITSVPLIGAAVTPATAAFVGRWADGLLTTTGGDVETTRRVIAAFREVAGNDKPIYLQHALSWAETEDEAFHQAIDQWGPVAAGGEVNWDLRRPSDFDRIGRTVGREEISQCVKISSDVDRHLAWIQELMELGADHIYLHCVGRNQVQFIETFGPRCRA